MEAAATVVLSYRRLSDVEDVLFKLNLFMRERLMLRLMISP